MVSPSIFRTLPVLRRDPARELVARRMGEVQRNPSIIKQVTRQIILRIRRQNRLCRPSPVDIPLVTHMREKWNAASRLHLPQVHASLG